MAVFWLVPAIRHGRQSPSDHIGPPAIGSQTIGWHAGFGRSQPPHNWRDNLIRDLKIP